MFNSKQRYNPSHGAGGSNSRWHLPPSQFPLGHQSESYNLHQRGQYGAYGHQQLPSIAPQSMQGGSNGGNFNMQTNDFQAFPGVLPSSTTYGPPRQDYYGPQGYDYYGPPGHDYYGPPGHDYYGPPGHDYYGPPETEISEKELRLQNLGRDRTTEHRMYELLSNECKDEAERDQQRTRLLVETVLEGTKLERAADQKSTSMMFDYANNNRKHPRDIDVDGDDSTEGVGRSIKKHRTSGNETEMQDENAIEEYIVGNILRQKEMARLKVKCDKQNDELKKIRGFRDEDLKNQKAELKDIQEQHGVDMEKAESQNKEIVQSKNEIIQSKNEQIQSKNEQIQSKEDRINEQIQSKEELATLQRQIIEKYEEEIKSLKKALKEKK